MRRLGIISCQVFERELSYILDERRDIDNVYMVRTPENLSFSRSLRTHKVKFIKEPIFLPRLSRSLDVLVNILPIGLHIDMSELEYECNGNIDSFKDCTSSILLFYGLCGNALSEIIKRQDVKLMYPSDSEGIVDDCVCSLLGRKTYLDELKRMGSYFIISGFVTHRGDMLKRISQRVQRDYTSADSKMMLEANGYERALLVRLGLEDEEYLGTARGVAAELDLQMESICGSIDLLRDAVDRALDTL